MTKLDGVHRKPLVKYRRHKPKFEDMKQYVDDNWDHPQFGMWGPEHAVAKRFKCSGMWVYYTWLEQEGVDIEAYMWAKRFHDLPELLMNKKYWDEWKLWGEVYRRRYTELNETRGNRGFKRFLGKVLAVYRMDFTAVRMVYCMTAGWNSFQLDHFIQNVDKQYGLSMTDVPGAVQRRRLKSGKTGKITGDFNHPFDGHIGYPPRDPYREGVYSAGDGGVAEAPDPSETDIESYIRDAKDGGEVSDGGVFVPKEEWEDGDSGGGESSLGEGIRGADPVDSQRQGPGKGKDVRPPVRVPAAVAEERSRLLRVLTAKRPH